MRPRFGHVLIACGLFLVMGCTLSGQRTANDDFGIRSKDRPNRRSQKSDASDDRLAFKPPRNKTSSSRSDAESDLAEFNNGLDSNRVDLRRIPSNSKEATSQSDVSPASHQHTNSVESFHSDSSRHRDETVKDNDFASVQIQGVEFDDQENLNSNSLQQISSVGIASRSPDSISSSAKQSDALDVSAIRDWSDRPLSHDEKSFQTDELNSGRLEAANQGNQSELPQYTNRSTQNRQLPSLPWQYELEQLITTAEQSLAASKSESSSKPTEYLRKQAHLRLLYMMAQRQEDALTAIPSVSTAQQEYWQQLIWAMSNSTDTAQFPDAFDRAAQSISPLSAALRLLREEAPLSIRNMTFCRKISYFGNYEWFQKSEFTPGQEVLLYTEIENFVSTPTSDGEYRTSLKSLIEIADEKGKTVWSKTFPPTEDFCRNPRRDYFHNYQFRIPEDIPTGAYNLRLTIADEISQKRVLNTLNFVVK